ncbi:MAG: type 1 glutamine amidotransferase domain-containing protein [Rhodanobacter sp.]
MMRWIKRGGIGCLGLAIALAVGGLLYMRSLNLDSQSLADPGSSVASLEFMRGAVPATRGRILAVVSSTARFPGSEKRAGFELTELSRAYYVFRANGYEVDIASPRGGEPPMRTDDDMVAADYAFLNDRQARAKLTNSVLIEDVDASRYAAVYFVGGKGAMFDFPNNQAIQKLVRDVYQADGIIGAVCHGPAALLEVVLDDGTPLLRGRRATGFTSAEEVFLMKDAHALFPYLLQDRMVEHGVVFDEAPMYIDNLVVDDRLITGQNPWSTWSVAEAMVAALGHAPVARERTGEELAMQVLAAYHREGMTSAQRAKASRPRADKRLLLMHALVAGMGGQLGDAYRLQTLAHD